MATKKKPSAKQLAARAKFVKMVRARAAAKKAGKKVAAGTHKDTKSHNVNIRVVSGLDKITRKGRKTIVHYSRVGGIAGTPGFQDPDMAREIELYAENDGDLYRQQRRPILQNLTRKYKKGTYDVAKAAKLWRYFIDTAMKKYNKDFGSKGDKWHTLLSTHDRQLLAEKWAKETKDEFDLGNYTE